MSKKTRQAIQFTLEPTDNGRLAELCGEFDTHLHQIERDMGVEISNRGHEFQVIGPKKNVTSTQHIIEQLYADMEQEKKLTDEKLFVILQAEKNAHMPKEKSEELEKVTIRTTQRMIKPRSQNQFYYLNNILTHDINFCIGPSGTGKTYLAVACAVQALERDEVRRIVLVRPAVEAGESLGFLPGDLAEKINPYLRPIYDALYEMMGNERANKLIEEGIIEVAPLAYMRGRNLNDSFVILDESQNTTKEQMKMLLTRLGFGSKMVVTGDITQVDLPKNTESGLRNIIEVLEDIEEISFTFFQAFDVVRHPLVQRIVTAYDKHERRN